MAKQKIVFLLGEYAWKQAIEGALDHVDIRFESILSLEDLVIRLGTYEGTAVIIAPLQFQGIVGLDLFHVVKAIGRNHRFVFCTEDVSPTIVVKSLREGVHNWIGKDDLSQIKNAIEDAAELKFKGAGLEEGYKNSGVLRSVIDAMSEHLIVINEFGQILYSNDAWLRFLDLNLVPILQRSNLFHVIEHLNVEPSSTLNQLKDALLRISMGGIEYFSLDYAIFPNKGDQRWYAVRMRRLSGKQEFVLTQANVTIRKSAELSLRKSQERFRNLFHRTSDGLVFLTNQGEIEDVNDSFLKLTGYSVEDLIGKSALNFIPKEDHLDFALRLKSRSSGHSETYEAKLCRKKGEIIEIEVHAIPQLNEGGEFLGTLSMIRDITSRKIEQRREKIQLSTHLVLNKLLQIEIRRNDLPCILSISLDLLSTLPFVGVEVGSAIFYWDRKGNRLHFSNNGDYSSIHDCISSQGMTCICMEALIEGDLIIENRINPKYAPYWSCVDHEQCTMLPIVCGGTMRGFIAIKERILDEVDLETLNTFASITGKALWEKEIQEKIFESEQRLKGIINSSSEITVIIDKKGLIQFVSPAVNRVLGYEEDEVLGTLVFDYFHKSDREKAMSAFNQRVISGGIGDYETYRLRSNKGQYRYLRTITSHNVDTPGIEGIVVNAHDITYLIEAERNKNLTIIRTEENERRRISRDLHDGVGQSIAASNMYFNTLELFAKDQLTQEAYEIFRTGQKIINHAAQEVRAVSHNIMPPSLKHFGFVETLRELISDYETLDNKINIELNENIDGYRFNPDWELTLYRILQELLNNAFRHAKAKNIAIILKIVEGDLLIEVNDDGCGFDFEDVKSRKSKGIGMISVLQRIDAIGGEMIFDSNQKNGTRIVIKFFNPPLS